MTERTLSPFMAPPPEWAAELALPLLELMPDALFLCDADKYLQHCNPAFLELFGLSELPPHLPLDEVLVDISQGQPQPVELCDARPQSLEVRVFRPASQHNRARLELRPLPEGRWLGLFRGFHRSESEPHSLEAIERRYSEVLEQIPAGIVVHGPQSQILQANTQACSILGLSRKQILGLEAIDPTWQFIYADGQPMALQDYPVNRVLSTLQRARNIVVGVQRRDAVTAWAMCNAFPVFDSRRQLCEVVVCFTEVTELKQAEQALRDSEERLHLVLLGSTDAPWDWDLLHNTIYYSPRWWQMLGRTPGELPATPELWHDLLAESDVARVDALLRQALTAQTQSFEFEFSLQHKDGHYLPLLARGFILRDAAGQAIRVSGTNTDLTERKETEARIHRLAYYDELTELPNRRLLMEQLRKALLSASRKGRRGALLFIDLDNFKALNDTQGHAIGDQLLQQVAQRLRHCVREEDSLCRLGGDEFVIMLEELGNSADSTAIQAEIVGQKILTELNRPYLLQGRPYRSTPSIGVALFNGQETALELLQQADVAMYQSKAEGRNTLRFFDPGMQAAVSLRVSLENDLREGIERQEMRLFFQPQVNALGTVVGAEVLLRWQHGERGMVSPAEFIPLAESTGLILPLGDWVLRQACEQLSQWSAHPKLHQLCLAVNVSPQQMHEERFVSRVKNILSATGIAPERLKLELTESSLARNIDALIGKMSELKTCGVRFSLDDFGTGYSSLSYLRRFPLDQLKIDQSFVRDITTDRNQADITRVIIALAEKLSLEVIAEGVETEEQLLFLHKHGCRRFQGYLFGRPMPLDEFVVFCEQNPVSH